VFFMKARLISSAPWSLIGPRFWGSSSLSTESRAWVKVRIAKRQTRRAGQRVCKIATRLVRTFLPSCGYEPMLVKRGKDPLVARFFSYLYVGLAKPARGGACANGSHL